MLYVVVPCVGMMESFSGDESVPYDSYASEEWSLSPESVQKKRRTKHRKARLNKSQKNVHNAIDPLSFNRSEIYSNESLDLELGENLLSDEFIAQLSHLYTYNQCETTSKVYSSLLKGIRKRRKTGDSLLSEIEGLAVRDMRKGDLKTAREIKTSRESAREYSDSSSGRLSRKVLEKRLAALQHEAKMTELYSNLGFHIKEETIKTKDRESSRNTIIGAVSTIAAAGLAGFFTYLSTGTSMDPSCLTCLLSIEVVDGAIVLSSECLQTCIAVLGG